MCYLFITPTEVREPDYFTVYHTINDKYLRIESEVDDSSFDKDSTVLFIELFDNRDRNQQHKPIFMKVVYKPLIL